MAEINPFEADINPNAQSASLPDQAGVQSQSGGNPFEQDAAPYSGGQNGNNSSGMAGDLGNSPSVGNHSTALAAGDMVRGVASAPLGIVDLGARIPTWMHNTADALGGAAADAITGKISPSYQTPYPPSLNDATQNLLTSVGLPVPTNNTEAYTSAGVRNWMFGPAGMAAGIGARALQQNVPAGNSNLTVGGRDLGLSPNDIAAGAVGAAAQGASLSRPSAISSAVGTDAARLAQTAMDNGIPVYPTDIAQGGVGKSLLDFYNGTPFSGKQGRMGGQQDAINTAATGAMGMPSDELTTPVMSDAADATGAIYNNMAAKYDVPVSPSFRSDLQDLQTKASKTLVGDDETAFNKQYNNVLDAVHNAISGQPSSGSGVITGTQYNNLRSQIGTAMSGKNGSSYLNDLQSMLDDRMQSQMTPNDSGQFTQARQQWRAMLALEPAAKKAIGNGNVDPTALLSGSSKIYPNTVYNDPNTIPQVAQVGQLLDKSWKGQSTYQWDLQHAIPWEIGQMSSWAASPLGALLNRTANAPLTSGELTAPYLSQFYKAARTAPAAIVQQPNQQTRPR